MKKLLLIILCLIIVATVVCAVIYYLDSNTGEVTISEAFKHSFGSVVKWTGSKAKGCVKWMAEAVKEE